MKKDVVMTKTNFSLFMTMVGFFASMLQFKFFKSDKVGKKRYCTINIILIVIIVFGSLWFIKNYEFLPEDTNLTVENMLIKAEEYYKMEDYLNAINIYNNKELDTNAISLSNLGYFYEHGMGVNKNIQKAKENYQKAKQLGNEDALDNWVICILNYPESYDEVLKCLKEGYDNNSQVTFEFISKSMSAGQINILNKNEVDMMTANFFKLSEDYQKQVLEGSQYEVYRREEEFSEIGRKIWGTYKARTEKFKEVIDLVSYEITTDTGEKISKMIPVYLERNITHLDILEKRFYFADEYQTRFIEYIE